MKRVLSFFVFLSTCLPVGMAFYFLLSTYSYADFNRAYQDYLFQYDKYRISLSTFLTAKNRYLTYQTLVSQNEALDPTKEFLDARDKVLSSYLQILLEKNPPENLAKLLNEEINFYSAHKNKIPAASSLEETVNLSSDFEAHFALTEVLSSQVIGNFLLIKVQLLENRFAALENGFEEKIKESQEKGKDVATLMSWLTQTKTKHQLAIDKLEEANRLLLELTQKSSRQAQQDFGKSRTSLLEANQSLKEAAAYLREIKEELKYGNY